MSRYGAGVNNKAGVNTANTAYFQVRPKAATRRLYIVELVVGVDSAPTTPPSFYLARSTANGTVTTTLDGQPFDEESAATNGTFDSAFSAAPTFSTTNKFGTGGLGVTAGGVWTWSFRDSPLIIDKVTTKGIVVVNASATGATLGAFSGSAMWDES